MIETRFVLTLASLVLLMAGSAAQSSAQNPDSTIKVRAIDGTSLAVECMGTGPTLLIVHGGTGDRRRWVPLLPLFAPHFTVCAMDRRGHGESGAGIDYSLRKEFEDVAAVVNALPGSVFVLGHSLGGVCALEAAFLTKKIAKLVLYEPPLQDLDHSVVADTMERLIQTGHREEALITFLEKIVMVSPTEIAAMKEQPLWPGRVAGIDIQIREIRELSRYRFDAERMRKLKIPTLLLTGSKTPSPQLRQAIRSLQDSLPQKSLYVFEGQEHNAMDHVPGPFAEVVTNFLLSKDNISPVLPRREKSTLLPSSEAKSVTNQCSRPSPSKFSGTWEPSNIDLQEMEARFLDIKKLKGEECCMIGARIANPEEYYMQYVGIIVDGKKLIYINALADSKPPSGWKEKAVVTCDGGTDWGVLYDPQTRKFFKLAMNGVA